MVETTCWPRSTCKMAAWVASSYAKVSPHPAMLEFPIALSSTSMTLSDDSADLQALREAVQRLEAPSVTIKIANMVGTPIEWALERLPGSTAEKIQGAIRVAL